MSKHREDPVSVQILRAGPKILFPCYSCANGTGKALNFDVQIRRRKRRVSDLGRANVLQLSFLRPSVPSQDLAFGPFDLFLLPCRGENANGQRHQNEEEEEEDGEDNNSGNRKTRNSKRTGRTRSPT